MAIESSSQSAAPTRILASSIWWQKLVIWGTFLLLIYLLREFFLIGFLTFLFCFVIRSLVGAIEHRVAPGQDRRGLDLFLTICTFIAFVVLLYGLGRLFVPQVLHQGKSLIAHARNLSASQLQNVVLAKTVGTWRFRHEFGVPNDPRYQEGLKEFQTSDRSGEGLYQTFPEFHSRIQTEFEANYEQSRTLYLQSQAAHGIAGTISLEQWFLQVKAPELFDTKGDYYRSRWEAEQALKDPAGALSSSSNQPDYESRRDEQIRQEMWSDVKSDPVLLAQLKAEWSKTQAIRSWDEFRDSPSYQAQFKEFYETQAKLTPDAVPIDYSFFQTLDAAYPKGKQAFLKAVRQHDHGQPESLSHQQTDFESAKKLEFGQQWWAGSHVADWVRDHATEDGPKMLESVVGWFDERLGDLFRVPVQIGTALLLSVFMLIEWQGIKSGVADLRNTRLRPIYDEIAPGMIALGKLIGKSMQGQMVIAFINACLTFIALWLIGIEYKFVLALVVFLFSFIPVVGVILSGGPICAVAILQPDGSLLMLVQVVVAIGIIHLIEGMYLSPRILGKIGDLHPVLVIVILLIAEKFFGMWGLVLGVPVAIYIIRVVILDSSIPGIYEHREANVPQELGSEHG